MQQFYFSLIKMFQGQAKKKKRDGGILYFYSSSDRLINKIAPKLQKKNGFHDLKKNVNFVKDFIGN
jgi:hypothetical protein